MHSLSIRAFLSSLHLAWYKPCVFACLRHRVSSNRLCRSRNLSGPSRPRTQKPEREGEEGVQRVEDSASSRDEKREGERGEDAHPGRVGRDNHRTDTDMLISESFTRDI